MRPSVVQATLLALSSASLTVAFEKLSFPSTVTADTDAKLQITNDLSSGASSFDAMFDSFRVYLSISAPGWGSGPSCYLVNSSAIATTELTLQIPASVGPDASSYSIVTMEFNQNPYADGPSGFEYSNDFAFTNGTGAWSKAELAGQGVADPDNVPCSAYNCARNCSQAFYPANVNNTDAYKSTYECTAACPGVTYLSWADMLAQDGGSASSSVIDADTQSTTSSGTASTTPKATTTTTRTGTLATASTTGKSSSASTSTTSTSSATTASKSASAGSQASVAGLTLLSTLLVSVITAIGL